MLVKPRYKHHRRLKLGGGGISIRKAQFFKQEKKTKQNKCLLKAQMDKSLTSSFGLCNKSLQKDLDGDFKGIKILKTRQLMNLKRAFALTGKMTS